MLQTHSLRQLVTMLDTQHTMREAYLLPQFPGLIRMGIAVDPEAFPDFLHAYEHMLNRIVDDGHTHRALALDHVGWFAAFADHDTQDCEALAGRYRFESLYGPAMRAFRDASELSGAEITTLLRSAFISMPERIVSIRHSAPF